MTYKKYIEAEKIVKTEKKAADNTYLRFSRL